MQTEISYIVNNPIERKGDRVLVRHAKLMISKTVDDKLIVKENKLYMVENKTKRL